MRERLGQDELSSTGSAANLRGLGKTGPALRSPAAHSRLILWPLAPRSVSKALSRLPCGSLPTRCPDEECGQPQAGRRSHDNMKSG
jgi:hypothetical protein